jgi:hypothetical protein
MSTDDEKPPTTAEQLLAMERLYGDEGSMRVYPGTPGASVVTPDEYERRSVVEQPTPTLSPAMSGLLVLVEVLRKVAACEVSTNPTQVAAAAYRELIEVCDVIATIAREGLAPSPPAPPPI